MLRDATSQRVEAGASRSMKGMWPVIHHAMVMMQLVDSLKTSWHWQTRSLGNLFSQG